MNPASSAPPKRMSPLVRVERIALAALHPIDMTEGLRDRREVDGRQK
jgi:hypothetical protein